MQEMDTALYVSMLVPKNGRTTLSASLITIGKAKVRDASMENISQR